MSVEPPLPVTQTNSGQEAKGTILGLEGMAVVPVLGGVVVSVLLGVLLVMGASSGIAGRIVFSLTPTALALGYVLMFVHRKPPNYQSDALEQWRGKVPVIGGLLFPEGTAFNAYPKIGKVNIHPLLKARASLKEGKNRI